MRSIRQDLRWARLLALTLVVSTAAPACGGDDDSPAAPSPPPAGPAMLVIENFTATSTAGPGGTFNYRASLRLRETGGASVTITGVTVTMTQTSGVSVSQDVPPAQAFSTTSIAASGTLDSNPLTVNSVPIAASQLAVRITYAGVSGGTASVQATTNVTAG